MSMKPRRKRKKQAARKRATQPIKLSGDTDAITRGGIRQHRYAPRLRRALKEGGYKLGPYASINVFHKSGCPAQKGGLCRCEATIRIGTQHGIMHVNPDGSLDRDPWGGWKKKPAYVKPTLRSRAEKISRLGFRLAGYLVGRGLMAIAKADPRAYRRGGRG